MFLNPLPPRLPHFIQLSLDILDVGLDAGDVSFQAFEDLVGVSGVDIGEQDAMVPRCRAAFYQDRVFNLDRSGQGRVEDSYLRLDFFKPGCTLPSYWEGYNALKYYYNIISQYPCFRPPTLFIIPKSCKRAKLYFTPSSDMSDIASAISFLVASGCS